MPAEHVQEQVAQQPGKANKPDTTNVTPWLGIQGHDGSNVTPWLGIPGYEASDGPVASVAPVQEKHEPAPEESKSQSDVTPAAGREVESRIPSKPTSGSPSNPGLPNGPRKPGGVRMPRPSSGTSSNDIAWPQPMTHVMTGNDTVIERKDAGQAELPVLPSTPQPERDLRTTVWDETPAASPAKPGPETQEEQVEELPTGPLTDYPLPHKGSAEESSVPDLPTTPLSSVSAQEQLKQHEQARARADRADIEQMPTAQWQMQDVKKPATSSPSHPGHPDALRDHSAPGFNEGQAAAIAPVQARPESSAQPLTPMAPAHAPKSKKRTILIAAIALVIICVLALGSWIVVAQPFTVSADTNPVQVATNNGIGATITYPTGWKSQNTRTAMNLADSSNTAQITLTQGDSSDATKYLQQQATQLGMTNAKAGAPISFAGQSWQQISGDFQLSGANYTGTLYATTYNNHLYTWKQIAPKNVFQDEERLVFVPARSSLHLR
ncbi:hypothetical protein KDA_36660 [Dictyobacter alpinus]|uniref:Uncharacterized protein n=1 Tax=Dictyobacter alpinus TaxID=2014873 RepID=A0A402BA52_9CHLR|nr:hypothetical protein [Dictyobacter alpinus]GCE28182.1 hypothetical protein KDA_36660 [Dictyobacter alpinus]